MNASPARFNRGVRRLRSSAGPLAAGALIIVSMLLDPAAARGQSDLQVRIAPVAPVPQLMLGDFAFNGGSASPFVELKSFVPSMLRVQLTQYRERVVAVDESKGAPRSCGKTEGVVQLCGEIVELPERAVVKATVKTTIKNEEFSFPAFTTNLVTNDIRDLNGLQQKLKAAIPGILNAFEAALREQKQREARTQEPVASLRFSKLVVGCFAATPSKALSETKSFVDFAHRMDDALGKRISADFGSLRTVIVDSTTARRACDGTDIVSLVNPRLDVAGGHSDVIILGGRLSFGAPVRAAEKKIQIPYALLPTVLVLGPRNDAAAPRPGGPGDRGPESAYRLPPTDASAPKAPPPAGVANYEIKQSLALFEIPGRIDLPADAQSIDIDPEFIEVASTRLRSFFEGTIDSNGGWLAESAAKAAKMPPADAVGNAIELFRAGHLGLAGYVGNSVASVDGGSMAGADAHYIFAKSTLTRSPELSSRSAERAFSAYLGLTQQGKTIYEQREAEIKGLLAQLLMANAFLDLGRLDLATTIYGEALKKNLIATALKTDSWNPQVNLETLAYSSTGEKNDLRSVAMASFRRLGVAQILKNDFVSAERTFRDLISRGVKRDDIILNLIGTLFEQEKYKEANDVLEEHKVILKEKYVDFRRAFENEIRRRASYKKEAKNFAGFASIMEKLTSVSRDPDDEIRAAYAFWELGVKGSTKEHLAGDGARQESLQKALDHLDKYLQLKKNAPQPLARTYEALLFQVELMIILGRARDTVAILDSLDNRYKKQEPAPPERKEVDAFRALVKLYRAIAYAHLKDGGFDKKFAAVAEEIETSDLKELTWDWDWQAVSEFLEKSPRFQRAASKEQQARVRGLLKIFEKSP